MALTDADRLQMTAMALMKYSVHEKESGLIKQPEYIRGFPEYLYEESYETLYPGDNISVSYSYTIE